MDPGRGSGPGPDGMRKIAEAGWVVEARRARSGRPLGDSVLEAHCSGKEKHNNNNNMKSGDASRIFSYDHAKNNRAGGTGCSEDIGGSFPSETLNDLFAPLSEKWTGREVKTMEFAD